MSNPIQSHPLRTPFLLFGLGVVVVLSFILWGQYRRDKAVEGRETLQRRLDFSRSGSIAPSAAILNSLQEANERLGKSNAALDGKLYPVGGSTLPDFSGTSTAAYFELAGFVEEMSRHFGGSGIALPEAVRFGFSQFEQQGPGSEILAAVMRQKAAAQMILEPLQQARPMGLISFKREFIEIAPETQTVLQQAAGTRPSRRTRPADTIEGGAKIDELESFTFEIIFEGYTESLRQFLKTLLQAPVPVVVTGLEVFPLDRYGPVEAANVTGGSTNPFDLLSTGNESIAEDGPVPIIRNNLSSFKLQLEVYTGKEGKSDA